MNKFVMILVLGFGVFSNADFMNPGNFQALLTAAGPVVQGSFTNLHLKDFQVDAKTDFCGMGSPVRQFQFVGTSDVTMNLGTQTYKFIKESPMMIIFKTQEGCKSLELKDAVTVGELAFVNTQFSNVRVLVHYGVSGNIEINGVPSGVILGQFISPQP